MLMGKSKKDNIGIFFTHSLELVSGKKVGETSPDHLSQGLVPFYII